MDEDKFTSWGSLPQTEKNIKTEEMSDIEESKISHVSESIEDKPISEEKKPVKRKAESSLTPTPKRRGNVKKSTVVDYLKMTPRYQGKLSKQMLFCQKVLRELQTGRRHSDFTWPFLEPVDVEGLQIYDYYDIIKEPIDFSTMQNKFTAKQYANPKEFHDDMMLIISNCLRYNPDGQPVNKCGKDLKRFFESKWKELPSEESSTPKPKSIVKSTPKPAATPKSVAKPKITPKPKVVVPQDFGELCDTGELNTLLSHVQNERQRVASHLDGLQQYETQLVQLRNNREEAQNEGNVPPTLSNELHTSIRKNLLTGLPPAFDVKTPGFSAEVSRLDSSRRAKFTPVGKVKVEHMFDEDSNRANQKDGSQNLSDFEDDQLEPENNEPDCEYQFDSDEEEGPMTFTEKAELNRIVKRLSKPRLARIFKIVMKREKEFSNIEPQTLEINFEELRPITLREIEAYFKACKAKDNVGAHEKDEMVSIV